MSRFLVAVLVTATLAQCARASNDNDNVADSAPPEAEGFIQGLAVDAAGNRFVCGYFVGPTDFNPGIGADVRGSGGSIDFFVTRYNADNSYAWTQTFGGPGISEGTGITLLNGVVYATGFTSSTSAQLGGTGPIYSAQGGFSDAFVVALDAATGAPEVGFGNSGVVILGGDADDESSWIAAGPNAIYVTGIFSSSNFNINGAGSVANQGQVDSFIVALDPVTGLGVPTFGTGGVSVFGGVDDDSAQGVYYSGGAVYVVGEFSSNSATVNGSGSIMTVTPGAHSTFLLKLDATTGNLFSFGSKIFGGSGGEDTANAVTVVGGTVYVAGVLASTDAGFGALGSISSAGGDDIFIYAISDVDGSPVTAFGGDGVQTFGGTGDDGARSIAVLNNTIYVSGKFNSSDAVFGGAPFGSAGPDDDDAVVLAFDKSTGAPVTTFAGDGALTFGGMGLDLGFCVATTQQGQVVMAGTSASFNAGVDGPGTFLTAQFLGFILPVDAVTGVFTPPPSVTGGTGTNVSDGKPPVVNPLTGVSVKVLRSSGGFVLLEVDVNSLNRAAVSPLTDFDDIPGRGSTGVTGKNPSHVFTKSGVFVSTTRAVEDGTNAEKGKMRKTLALSSRETGGSGALQAAPDPSITVTGMKGKFLFSKSTPDQVAFTGTIALPAGIDPKKTDGNELSIGIGNITDNVVIDPKGKGKLPSEKNRIKTIKVKYPKLPKGQTLTVGGEKATVSMTYSTADMDLNGFDTEGITTTFAAGEDGTKGVPRNIQVAMVINGVAYESLAPVTFKVSKKGDAGTMGRTSK